jgi:hypothetical protein
LDHDRNLEYNPEIERHRQAETCDAFMDFMGNITYGHKKTPNQGRGLIQGGGEALTKAIKLCIGNGRGSKTLTEAKYSTWP